MLQMKIERRKLTRPLWKKKKQARLGGDAFQDEGTVKTMALSESSTLTDERKSKKAGMA